MSNQSYTNPIATGLVLAFDIFERKDIEKVNEKVSETLGTKPNIKETPVSKPENGFKAYINYHASWNIKPVSFLLKTLVSNCDEKGFKCDFKVLEKYVENFRVEGYDSSSFPAYVFMVSVSLKNDALNKSEDLKKDLLQIGLSLRLFVERFEGLSRYESAWTPRATVITQLWIKTSKKNLEKMQETALDHVKQQEGKFENSEQRIKDSESLRKLEPLDLSAPIGDVHSYIISAVNVLDILGHTHQLALNGLRTPYILTLSYSDNIFPKDPLDSMNMWLGVPVQGIGEITWRGHSCLVYLNSLSMYLNYIALMGRKIDIELSNLRSHIDIESPKNEIDQLNEQLTMTSTSGTQISSFISQLGNFSRQWEGSIRRLSAGRSIYALEIPISPIDPLFLSTYTNFLASLDSNGGYLETLSKQILQRLEVNKESFKKQESEVASLEKYVSTYVNLATSRINVKMSERIERLTWITVILGVVFTTDTIALFNLGELTIEVLIQYIVVIISAILGIGWYIKKK
jgi:hypothetical protein